MIVFNEFKEKCNSRKCLLYSSLLLYSNQCMQEKKQKKCYEKYINKFYLCNTDATIVDAKWEELKQIIRIRDNNECVIYRILTKEEKKIVESHDNFWYLLKILDGAHIVSRLKAPHHIYNTDNVVLMSRFFHYRIDNMLDLVTGQPCTKIDIENWWTRIMQSNGYWNKNTTYSDFVAMLMKK